MESFEDKVINWAGRVAVPLARFALFFIYFYFGLIKVFFENGAANPMVLALLEKTMPTLPPDAFLIAFGVFEMILGLLFIIPRMERLGLFFLALHIIVTVLPLIILPALTWQRMFVPTIEGQYIFKNILIIALAVVILASMPTSKEKQMKATNV